MRKFACSFAIAACAHFVSACGGQVIYGSADSGTVPVTSVTGDSQTDGGPGGTGTGSSNNSFPECPGVQPKAGYSCTTPNQGCAYVDVTTHDCVSWTCTSSLVWVNSTPAGC